MKRRFGAEGQIRGKVGPGSGRPGDLTNCKDHIDVFFKGNSLCSALKPYLGHHPPHHDDVCTRVGLDRYVLFGSITSMRRRNAIRNTHLTHTNLFPGLATKFRCTTNTTNTALSSHQGCTRYDQIITKCFDYSCPERISMPFCGLLELVQLRLSGDLFQGIRCTDSSSFCVD